MRRVKSRRHAWLLGAAALASIASIAATSQPSPPPPDVAPVLILVSLDGWRWDYIDRFAPPTLSRLAREGVHAEGLIPVFPSKTFPNHFSIVTGLYPMRHGIIANTMLDPALPNRFSMGSPGVLQDTRWWGGEPIWVTAERQGQIAATMFWPGSDVEINGARPTYWRLFDDEVSNESRVDQVLEWLRQPGARRPSFLTLYVNTMDDVGHDAGPDAPATRDASYEVDRILARLLSGVRDAGLETLAHYVVVSDHGMASLSPDRIIVLDDYLDVSTVDLVDSSPAVGLNPRSGSEQRVVAALEGQHPALQVFTRATVPAAYRLRGHPRLPAVLAVADDGWHLTTRASLANTQGRIGGGNHGYDPRHRSMHGLFVAAGPKFQRALTVPAFENVHLYELMCRLLALQPAANDGSATVTASFLR